MKFLQVLLLLSFMGVLILYWPKLMSWFNQPIARVEVHAPFDFLQQQDIENLLRPYLHKRFFQVDLKAARKVLLKEPWVKEVALKKSWPDRLVVTLEEKEAVARWRSEQLITAEGDIFRPSSLEGFEKLPALDGPEDNSQEIIQQYLSISQLLRPLGLAISGLKQSSTGAWRFTVGDTIVSVGRDRRMEKLQRFIRLYHARLEPKWGRVKRVDLRYINGAAVAWANE